MFKKICVLLSVFVMTSVSAYESPNLRTLWETVKANQNQEPPQGLAGGWPEEIILQEHAKKLFTDYSPFSALQIMLRLEAINARTPLPGYDDVKNKFKPFADYYLNHRLKEEPFGSIGFWPVWQLESGLLIRAPSTDPQVRAVTGDTLPADTDDSSQMAIWLQKTEPSHPFIQAYLSMLETVLDEGRTEADPREIAWKDLNSGAFLTWVKKAGSQNQNNVDCIVNINILTSLSLIKKSHTISNKLSQAEQDTSDLIFKVLKQGKVPQCTYYYSRWSQFFLALGKLYEAGGGAFSSEQWQTIQSAYKSYTLNHWNPNSDIASGEWAELLITAKMFGIAHDPVLKSILDKVSSSLLEKIRNGNYYTHIEGNDVFRGTIRPGMTLLWFVQAQTATFLLEALS